MTSQRVWPMIDSQYGFLKDANTLGAAVDLINYISRSLDENQI